MDGESVLRFIGGIAFGGVIGWITYFIMRRAQPKALTDLTTIVGILGGGTIIGLFDPKTITFAGYAIGLAIGFFGYYLFFLKIVGKHAIGEAILKQGSTQSGAPMAGAPMGGGGASPQQGTIVDWGADRGKK